MNTLQFIQLGAEWGLIFGLVFCAATPSIGRLDVTMLVNEYPPDVRAKFRARN